MTFFRRECVCECLCLFSQRFKHHLKCSCFFTKQNKHLTIHSNFSNVYSTMRARQFSQFTAIHRQNRTINTKRIVSRAITMHSVYSCIFMFRVKILVWYKTFIREKNSSELYRVDFIVMEHFLYKINGRDCISVDFQLGR